MNILFHSDQISIRGTEVAVYDYACGNEDILKGKSFIASPIDRVQDESVLKKFQKRFKVILYKDLPELENFIQVNNIELLYQISSGKEEKLLTNIVPTFRHCVFTLKSTNAKYNIPISQYLNRYFKKKGRVLPHIINKFPGESGNLREDLNIPESATVFGGYGGKKQFDIDFVKKAVIDITRKDSNIYFIFLNFEPFIDNLENIIFLPKDSRIEYKEKFINTCDAMLHARSDGETFGLSIAEFSIKNRPIITWKPNIRDNFIFQLKTFIRYIRGRKHIYATAHLDFLGKKALTYSSYNSLMKLLTNYNKDKYKKMDLDCYSRKFSSDKVMRIFHEIINS